MKSNARIVCALIALAWGHAALAAEATTEVPPPSHGVAVKAHHVKKGDRAYVEKRLADRAALNKKRTEQARKAELEHQRLMPVSGN